MFIESTSIDLFDQNMDIWHVPKLDSDVHTYYWIWFIWSKFGYGVCQS